jgi:hypothetical protein
VGYPTGNQAGDLPDGRVGLVERVDGGGKGKKAIFDLTDEAEEYV